MENVQSNNDRVVITKSRIPIIPLSERNRQFQIDPKIELLENETAPPSLQGTSGSLATLPLPGSDKENDGKRKPEVLCPSPPKKLKLSPVQRLFERPMSPVCIKKQKMKDIGVEAPKLKRFMIPAGLPGARDGQLMERRMSERSVARSNLFAIENTTDEVETEEAAVLGQDMWIYVIGFFMLLIVLIVITMAYAEYIPITWQPLINDAWKLKEEWAANYKEMFTSLKQNLSRNLSVFYENLKNGGNVGLNFTKEKWAKLDYDFVNLKIAEISGQWAEAAVALVEKIHAFTIDIVALVKGWIYSLYNADYDTLLQSKFFQEGSNQLIIFNGWFIAQFHVLSDVFNDLAQELSEIGVSSLGYLHKAESSLETFLKMLLPSIVYDTIRDFYKYQITISVGNLLVLVWLLMFVRMKITIS